MAEQIQKQHRRHTEERGESWVATPQETDAQARHREIDRSTDDLLADIDGVLEDSEGLRSITLGLAAGELAVAA